VICNGFLPNWLIVVSSCLLQYKTVCVTNFDKLCHKMLKKVQVYWSFWYSYSLAVSVLCDVMPGYACFVCIVMHLRWDKKLFIIPFYVLRTYSTSLCLYVCIVSLITPITCSLVRFPGMTSSLAVVKKHLLALFLKFPNFLMFHDIRIDLLILKTHYGQFTLTTKKSLHIIFKRSILPMSSWQTEDTIWVTQEHQWALNYSSQTW